MKRTAVIFICLMLLPLAACKNCREDKYKDARQYFNELHECVVAHGKRLSGAETGSEVAAAINDYGKEIAAFLQRGEALQKQFPELADEEHPPAELKAEFDRLHEANSALAKISEQALNKFIDDPAVMQAIINISRDMKAEE